MPPRCPWRAIWRGDPSGWSPCVNVLRGRLSVTWTAPLAAICPSPDDTPEGTGPRPAVIPAQAESQVRQRGAGDQEQRRAGGISV